MSFSVNKNNIKLLIHISNIYTYLHNESFCIYKFTFNFIFLPEVFL